MEERISMTSVRSLHARHASAAGFMLLAMLAGCATGPTPPATQIPVPTPSVVAAASPAPEPRPATPAAPMPSPEAASAPGEATVPADAAGVPSDPVRPETPVDLQAVPVERDLWARVRRGFAMPDLDNDLVRDKERWYATRPDYVQRMTERSSRYLFHIVEEVERRGMPTELALLPFIESAFNPQAMSSAKASGMWQFIPSTGKHYELTQNIFRDDRRDVLASTRAALDYLQKLYGMFGDWHLALAAYNWGEGSVGRALAKNRKADLPTDYDSLSMPAETRQYVPKLQAVKNLIARPEAFGLVLAPLENHPYFLTVPIQRDIDAVLVARLAGLPIAEFHALNPSLNKPVILASGTPQVLLPYDNADAFLKALPRHRGPLASWTAWVVPKTMKPADAAKQAGMSEATLREVNRIPPRMLIKAGSTLLVPRNDTRHADVSERVADGAAMHLVADAPALRRSTVKARRGDSVASIATRYRVSAANVATWNKVSAGTKFAAGQAVVIYTPASAKKARVAATAKPAGRKPPVKAAGGSAKHSADKAR